VKAFCISILLCLMAAAAGFAQTAAPPAADGSTNQLSVSLWLPRTAEAPHAPAAIHMYAYVASSAPAQKGDVVRIDFYAGTNLLGSNEAVWHAGIRPDPHSNKPQPMIVSLPGFSPASMVWSNVPAGTYALTARASEAGGATAVSPPANLTVQP
jgi:hypothetical protein